MRISLGFLCALALGCTGRTEIVLGVATDLKARGQLDSVQLNASRDGVTVITHSWPLTDVPAGEFELPGSFGIYSPDGSEPRVQIDVQGFLNNNVVVDRQSLLSLVSGQTLFSRLALVSDCNSEGGPTCSATETCIEGVCRQVTVDAHTFPTFSTPLVTHIACQSGAQLIVSSSGAPMPLLSAGATCGPNQFCQEGTCYRVLKDQDAAVESGLWTDQAAPVTDVLHGVWQSPDGQDLFAVGDAGTILHLTGGPSTGASSWVKEPSGTLANLYGVWGSSANDVWVTGTLYGSPVSSPPPAPSTGILLHRTGGTWAVVPAPTTATLRALAGTNTNDVWAVGLASPAPALLHYDGASWSSATLPAGAVGELLAVSALSTGDVTAVGRSGLVLHSAGAAFSSESLAAAAPASPVPDLTGVVALGSDEHIAVGTGGFVGHWQSGVLADQSTPVSTDLFAVALLTKTDLVAVGDFGVILRGTRDAASGAISWATERSGTSSPLFAVAAGATVQWVAGRSGTVRALATSLPPCSGDGDCQAGTYCASSATCQPQKPAGSPMTCDTRAGHDCLTDGCRECVSGSCVDGYCCDTSCTDLCEACDVSGSEGVCSPVLSGPPHAGIPSPYPTPIGSPSPTPQPFPRVCGRGMCAGVCDGAKNPTACEFPRAGLTCSGGPTGCVVGGGTMPSFIAPLCDANGFCSPSTICGLLTTCNKAVCPNNCFGDADCINGYYCAGETSGGGPGTCQPTLANGVDCHVGGDGAEDANACQTGFCAPDVVNKTNVCCATACTSTCASSTTQQNYTCTGGTCAVLGSPVACDVGYTCTNGACNSVCFCPAPPMVGTCPGSLECDPPFACDGPTLNGMGQYQGLCQTG